MREVYIEYWDHKSFADWRTLDEVRVFKPVLCKIKGELVVDADIYIVVCAESNEDGDLSCGTAIVRGAIDKIEYID